MEQVQREVSFSEKYLVCIKFIYKCINKDIYKVTKEDFRLK